MKKTDDADDVECNAKERLTRSKMKNVFLLFLGCILIFSTGCDNVEEFFVELEAESCVDDIIESETALITFLIPQTEDLIPTCDKVKITKKISEGKWEAVAYLSHGGKKKCIVYYDENEDVCVKMEK